MSRGRQGDRYDWIASFISPKYEGVFHIGVLLKKNAISKAIERATLLAEAGEKITEIEVVSPIIEAGNPVRLIRKGNKWELKKSCKKKRKK